MHIEKLDRVVFGVRDVREAANFFSNILGIKFYHFHGEAYGRVRTAAISRLGIELVDIQPGDKEVFRGLLLKVSDDTDLEEAKAEMESYGIRVEEKREKGGFKEYVFNKEDCYGIKLALGAYDVPHGGLIAVLKQPEVEA
ncbi:MAG: VOC family protein [Chloroflexi bacterium]|nr:VOC family protein [Chloroflexota bacterium]